MKPSFHQAPASSAVTHSAFFADPNETRDEARAMATEAVTRFLVWIAESEAPTQRGMRATIALHCVRPDLIGGATLEQIGAMGGCTGQAAQKLAKEFRVNMNLEE